ncbi:EpsG family protein [Polluticaenibacter yanchengensis]|uniref:EpsG family protein n=1 Tax=Polluticaenibacter yanchengensis TaxID=3014562 RepID=A0ABT4UQ01_9BACT|nr:EpsG family protein [Chitinophagaceae bacterium LY-5]
MIIYIIFFIFIAVLAAISSYSQSFRENTLIRLSILLLLILFVGLRGDDVSVDDPNYRIAFDSVESPIDYFINFSEWTFFEPFYYLIPSIVKLFFTKYYTIIFLVYAFTSISLKFNSIKKYTDLFYPSLLVYFSFLFFLHDFTQIRASVAGSLMLFSLRYVKNRELPKFLLTIIISCFFHYSSLVFFPIYFISTTNSKKVIYIILLCLSIIISFIDTSFILNSLPLEMSVLTNKAENYRNLAEQGFLTDLNKFNTNIIIFTLLSFFYLLKIDFLKTKNEYAIICIKIQVLALFLFQILSSIPAIAFRVSELGYTVTIITIPFVMYFTKNKLLSFFILLLICIILFYLNIFKHNLILPYKFVSEW